MPPKKFEMEQAIESLQQDLEKLTAVVTTQNLEQRQGGERVSRLENAATAMLERLDQRFQDEDAAKKKQLELPKGKGPVVALASSGVVKIGECGSSEKASESIATPTPTKEKGEESSRSGSVEPAVTQMEGSPTARKPPRTRKLELPVFNGENADSWIMRVEQYFEGDNYNEEEKLRALRMCFDGEALMWYRWEKTRCPFPDWNNLKQRVLEQYSVLKDATAGERLLKMSQEGTVREFIQQFISLATNTKGIPDPVLEMAFMNALKPKIRAGVRMFEPKTLQKMMDTAKLVEEWTIGEAPSGGASGGGGFSPKPSYLKSGNPNTLMGRPQQFKPNSPKPTFNSGY